jgi:hypothetical protein
MPHSPLYKDQAAYSVHGPSQQTAADINAQFIDLSNVNPYFHFYDAHQGGEHDYGDEDAHDMDHLSETGAIKFSKRLDSLLHDILGN